MHSHQNVFVYQTISIDVEDRESIQPFFMIEWRDIIAEQPLLPSVDKAFDPSCASDTPPHSDRPVLGVCCDLEQIHGKRFISNATVHFEQIQLFLVRLDRFGSHLGDAIVEDHVLMVDV